MGLGEGGEAGSELVHVASLPSASMWEQAVLACWQYPVQTTKDVCLQMFDCLSLEI